MEIIDEKKNIRERIELLRAKQPSLEKHSKDRPIQEKLFSSEEFKKAKTVSIYLSREEEVETGEIVKKAQSMGKQVAVPFLSPDNQPAMYLLGDSEKRIVSPEKLDLVIAPGIAFDRKGGRLGRGKGFYDIFLEKIKGKVPIIGLAYSFQVLEELPQQAHDISMDKIITEQPSLVIMTGQGRRHCYFANQLIKHFEVKAIVSEAKKAAVPVKTAKDQRIIEEHFSQRDEAEARYFKDDAFALPKGQILKAAYGESNSTKVFNWLKNLGPDLIILYGSSIIRDPLLSFFNERIINIHLGLSPYYRGAGTNFWPLVNQEPECVGATIHLAVLKVDAGPILAQIRPEIIVSDSCHDFGCKTIVAGAEMMGKCINLYYQDLIKPQVQPLGGRVYRRKDFNAQAVRKMRDNFEKGMVKEYLENKEARIKQKPIIEI